MFLGPMTYPDPKGERNNRMSGKRRSCPGVRGEASRVGWPGASQPPAPTDPGVTLARHRALLTSWSVRVDPPPVGEQAGLSLE